MPSYMYMISMIKLYQISIYILQTEKKSALQIRVVC